MKFCEILARTLGMVCNLFLCRGPCERLSGVVGGVLAIHCDGNVHRCCAHISQAIAMKLNRILVHISRIVSSLGYVVTCVNRGGHAGLSSANNPTNTIIYATIAMKLSENRKLKRKRTFELVNLLLYTLNRRTEAEEVCGQTKSSETNLPSIAL